MVVDQIDRRRDFLVRRCAADPDQVHEEFGIQRRRFGSERDVRCGHPISMGSGAIRSETGFGWLSPYLARHLQRGYAGQPHFDAARLVGGQCLLDFLANRLPTINSLTAISRRWLCPFDGLVILVAIRVDIHLDLLDHDFRFRDDRGGFHIAQPRLHLLQALRNRVRPGRGGFGLWEHPGQQRLLRQQLLPHFDQLLFEGIDTLLKRLASRSSFAGFCRCVRGMGIECGEKRNRRCCTFEIVVHDSPLLRLTSP